MARQPRPSVVVVATASEGRRYVHGPYSPRVGMAQADRLRARLAGEGGGWRVAVEPLERGPVRILDYPRLD